MATICIFQIAMKMNLPIVLLFHVDVFYGQKYVIHFILFSDFKI